MEQSLPELKVLFYSTNKVIKQILSKASDQLVQGIAELALNVLHNENLNISPSDRSKLLRHRRLLTVLADRRETLARKRYYVRTKGYRLAPLLLKLTLPYVARNGLGAPSRMEAAERPTG